MYDRSEVYKTLTVSISGIRMTKPRMYGSKRGISRNAILAKVQGLCGLVKFCVMKVHILLQAISSKQAHRGNLKAYMYR